MSEFIDKPLKQYDSVYRDSFKNNCKDLFNQLIKESNIDVDGNKKTCKEYYETEKQEKSISKKLRGLKTLRVFVIVFWIVASIVAIVACGGKQGAVGSLAVIIPIVLSVIAICLLIFVFKPKIKSLSEQQSTLSSKMTNLKEVAFSLIEPLFERFTFDIPQKLVEKTVPNFEFDGYFDLKRYFHLVENYGMSPELDANQSALSVVSGEFNESPFVVYTCLNQTMISKVYVGTLTIHWTTTSRDSEGRLKTEHHTQVLHAESIHPAPNYFKDTTLVFASDAAPDLSFSRASSDIDGLSDKQIEKKIDKLEKKAEKKAKKDIKSGESFTTMSNSEFESLFGATDRNNEVQFRLLFTPLAQQNEVETIRDKKYFGDDFSFYKRQKLNYIASKHSRGFDFSGNPSSYVHFDIAEVENRFASYNEKFFQNIYFDMIPLLNIPLYQQLEPIRTDDKVDYSKCGKLYNPFEIECLANTVANGFAPERAKTPCILKTKVVASSGGKDVAEVTAYSFDSVSRVDFIPVLGRDGKMHPVPVPWEEFIPISASRLFEVSRNGKDGSCQVNQRGFTARIIK